MKNKRSPSLLLIVIILLPSLFFAESHKTALDSLSEPFLIDTSIVFGPDPSDNSEYSAIAFDGVNYMVVWHDDRNGNWDIYGTRVNQAGELLDSMGVLISQGSSVDDKFPDIAFDGVNYLVVWQCSLGIRAARVTPAGQVLDPVDIIITDLGYRPAVACCDSSSLVVWQDTLGYSWCKAKIYGARIDTAGYVLDTIPIEISVVSDINQHAPDVSFSSNEFLVVWLYDYGSYYVYAKRIDQSGTVLDTIPIEIASQFYYGPSWIYDPAIAFGDANFFIVWTFSYVYSEDYTCVHTYGAVVDTSGTVLTDAFLIWSTWLLQSNESTYPSAAFDGENFLVVWSKQFYADNDDIYGQQIALDGTLIGGHVIISSASNKQHMTNIAYGDTTFFAVWTDRRNDTSWEIYGARVTTQGSVVDPSGIVLPCVMVAYAQHDPVVASDGTNYLVVWEDEDNFDIRGRRVSHTAQALDSSIIDIATSANVLLCPKTMYNNNDYVVLYKERWADRYGRLCGMRVDTAGSVIAGPIIIAGPGDIADDNLAMTFDGDRFLIVWSRYVDYYWWEYLYIIDGRLVTSILGGVNSFETPHPWALWVFRVMPSVCTNGESFLVPFTQSGYSGDAVKGYKIDNDGNLVPPEIHIADFGENTVSVFDVDNYLLVWEIGGDLKGVRVTPSCSLLNEVVICTASGDQVNPAMVFDGEYYWIVWQDNRNGEWDIYSAKVDTAGTVLEEFPIADQPGNQVTPEIALGPDNQLFITYSGWTGTINGIEMNTMRIWGIVATDLGIIEVTSPFEITEPLLSIVPNPFFRRVTIRYVSPVNASNAVSLRVYNAAGQVVREFNEIPSNTDAISLIWDGTDEKGRQLPQGIYFVNLTAGDYSDTEKVIFLR